MADEANNVREIIKQNLKKTETIYRKKIFYKEINDFAEKRSLFKEKFASFKKKGIIKVEIYLLI